MIMQRGMLSCVCVCVCVSVCVCVCAQASNTSPPITIKEDVLLLYLGGVRRAAGTPPPHTHTVHIATYAPHAWA